MLEVRQAMVEPDAGRQAEVDELVALEGDDIAHRCVAARMSGHVDQRRRRVPHGLVALVEIARCVKLVELLFEGRGEIIFRITLEEAYEKARNNAPLIIGDQALLYNAHIAAISQSF